MKKALLVAAFLAAAIAASSSPARVTPSTASRCSNGVADRIGGRVVCIHVGGRCVASHEAKYRARGYTCARGRLRRRVKKVSVSIADASIAEGNAGQTTVSVPVTLSAASTSAVTVGYATSDGTATAGSDYASTNGRLTISPGATRAVISISISGDTVIEPDETFTVALSNAANATIGQASATVTIRNDDTAVAITPGTYQGSTQNGNYVFLTVTPDRTITGLRFNDLTEICDPPARLPGGSDFGTNVFHIDGSGGFRAAGTWSGSQQNGDIELTNWSANVAGTFTNATSVNGTITEKIELNYKGTHYKCSSGEITWSAIRRG